MLSAVSPPLALTPQPLALTPQPPSPIAMGEGGFATLADFTWRLYERRDC
jgi:hypothetical protein